ncbi:retrovirus-related Pol polyprotein from transposon TNT 1-94 [Trichonephila clavipes]|nr:retrovirus-related Pol polyprotein from transposon TNT 1-94 [Trichonephila clavipes]
MEKSPQQKSWRRAMDKEFDNLKLRNVWKLTKLPPDKQLLGCRWKLNWCNCTYFYSIVLLVYVDDIVIFGQKERDIEDVLTKLKGKFNLKIMGKGIMYSKRQCPQSSDEKREMKIIPYRNVLGCLSFLAGRTRPDISYAVNLFSQLQNDPGLEHWYDFAANREDRISMGGQFICLGNTPVTWRTFKEKSVMKGGAFVNREKVNSLIPFKIINEWLNYLIGWRSSVSVTFDRMIGSRQEGGDFRYDEYKKQDVTF